MTIPHATLQNTLLSPAAPSARPSASVRAPGSAAGYSLHVTSFLQNQQTYWKVAYMICIVRNIFLCRDLKPLIVSSSFPVPAYLNVHPPPLICSAQPGRLDSECTYFNLQPVLVAAQLYRCAAPSLCSFVMYEQTVLRDHDQTQQPTAFWPDHSTHCSKLLHGPRKT